MTLTYILLPDITVLDTIYDHNINSIYIVIYNKRIKAKSTKWQKRSGNKITECMLVLGINIYYFDRFIKYLLSNI